LRLLKTLFWPILFQVLCKSPREAWPPSSPLKNCPALEARAGYSFFPSCNYNFVNY
jgi:hypothetical protein